MEQGREEEENDEDNGRGEVRRVAVEDEYMGIVDIGTVFGHGALDSVAVYSVN